jgi:hypothetical protein
MIRHITAVLVGNLVAFGLLILFDGGTRIVTDRNTAYVVALTIGGLCTFFWPVALGFILGRRARSRRDAQIDAEVDRRMNQG